MYFSNIGIILVETSHPGNIGSAARAMKTMGLEQLCLVNPKCFPDPKALELAASAGDVLANAKVFASLTDALAEYQLIFATSARIRGIGIPQLTPRQSAEKIADCLDIKVAIVFGRERSGLTNEELLQAHAHVIIPTNPDYSSLNIAQAVQIISYEIRCFLDTAETSPRLSNPTSTLANAYQVEQLYEHLTAVMTEVNFYNPKYSKNLLLRVRRLFNRCCLEQMEVNILRGFLRNIQHCLTKKT